MSRMAWTIGALALGLGGGVAWADDATERREVVVTGEKTDRSLQDTVTSVAVVDARKLEQEAIQTFFDIVARTANVSSTYGGSGFTIRGVSNTSVSGGGSGGLATVYVDGAAIPERALNNGPLDMWDVAQVEILRGPQSTLQGRNALAGAVVIRTTEPTWTWSGRARAMVSDAGERSLAFAGGGPIIADQLAFRLAVEDRKADGFVYNTTREQNEDPTDATTIRGKLLLTPDALPDLTARLVWTHDERVGGYVYSYSRTDVADPFDNRITGGDFPNDSDSTADILTLEADYRLSDRFDLTSVTAWSRVENLSRYDGDYSPVADAFGILDEEDEVFSQELRLAYSGERLSGLVGAYYARRIRDYVNTTQTNVPTPAPTLQGVLMGAPFGLDAATAGAIANLYVSQLPAIPVDYFGSSPEDIRTMALFGDGRLQITPQLSILAGFRYDREENIQSSQQVASFAGTYPDPAAFGSLAPVIGGLNQVVGMFVASAGGSAPTTSRDFEAFLPKLGAKYDLTDDASVSFVVQRGYRSGGSAVNVARSSVVPYDPEFTWNYELALRTSWLDDALTLNANAYYVDWTDQQVMVNLGMNIYDTQTENAGASHLYGFEIEGAWRPAAPYDLYASVGHTQTEFEDFEVTMGSTHVDLTGSEFAFAPHWTWAVGGNYRWDGGLFLNLNASYRSDAFSNTGVTQSDFAIDARTLVNGRFGYDAGDWRISVYGRNLLDEPYVQYEQAGLERAILGDPRVIGAAIEIEW